MNKKIKRATNYRRGADAERRAKRDMLFPRKTSNLPALFRADTWLAVTRAAGSKGDWDLVALGRAQVLLLSVKRVGDVATARRLLGNERYRLERLPLPAYARAGVACWIPGYGWLTTGLVQPRAGEMEPDKENR